MEVKIKEGSGTYGQIFGVEEKSTIVLAKIADDAVTESVQWQTCNLEKAKNTDIEKDLTELFTKFPFVLSASRRKDSNGLKNVDELVKAVMRIVVGK